MSIDPARLARIADRYVSAMTSIRGRRVHRLVMRAFRDDDRVLEASTDDGRSALVALRTNGSMAICCTNGTGNAAPILECAAGSGVAVTTLFDLGKDSLPIVGWALWHPALVRAPGTLTVSTASLTAPEVDEIARLLASVTTRGTSPA